ncbi:MAG: hypothetical protein ACRDTA_23305 [Pseudonocardiaceae bacterium]
MQRLDGDLCVPEYLGQATPAPVRDVIATAETVIRMTPVPRRHTTPRAGGTTLVADSTRIRTELVGNLQE